MSFYSDTRRRKTRTNVRAAEGAAGCSAEAGTSGQQPPCDGARNREQQRVQAHQNALRPASTYLTGGGTTRSQPYAASQQNQLFSAKKAAEQRRNPRQNVSAGNKSSGDGNPILAQFLQNSMDWHKTSDPDKRAQLHAQNDALRRKLGYEYNPQTGASFDKFGHEMTAGRAHGLRQHADRTAESGD